MTQAPYRIRDTGAWPKRPYRIGNTGIWPKRPTGSGIPAFGPSALQDREYRRLAQASYRIGGTGA